MKKTMQKALRPISSKILTPPPNIRVRIIQNMERLVKEALNGSKLSARYVFVLDYLSAVVNFHNATDPITKNGFLAQIGEKEHEGYSHGFKREELSSLNFLVLQAKARGQLSVLAQRIKEKEH